MNDQSVIAALAARKKATAPATEPADWIAQIAMYAERARKAEVAYEVLLSEFNKAREAGAAREAELQARLDAVLGQKTEVDRMCAEYKGRCDAMDAKPKEEPEEDYEAKYEETVAALTDLRVQHAACAPREEAQRRIEDMLRTQIDNMHAHMKASKEEDPAEVENEPEDATGCEIDVIRGGDARIRSLRVRYTK